MAYKAHKTEMSEEEIARANANNTQNIKNAAKVAKATGHPIGMAVGEGIEVADKLTGGKSSQALGQMMTRDMQQKPHAELGQAALNKLNESGIGNKIGQAADIKNAVDGTPSSDKVNSLPETNNLDDINNSSKKTTKGLFSSENDNEFKLPKIKAGPAIGIFGGFFALIISLVFVVVVIFATGDIIKDFFSGIGEDIVAFFDNIKDEKNRKNELKFYEELQKVQEELNRREGVCIDVNLITAALTVDVDHIERLYEEDGTAASNTYEKKVEKTEFGDEETDIYTGENDTEYTRKMRKQVALLGAMQIKHNKYIPSKAVPCADVEIVRLIDKPELAEEADITFFDWLMYGDTNKNVISETIRDIANNDEEKGLLKLFNTLGKIYVPFWQKAWNKEKNYAYYIYQPANPEGVASDKENLRRNEYVTYQEEYRSTDGKNPKSFDDWYYDYQYEQYKENLDEGDKQLKFNEWKVQYNKETNGGKYRKCDRQWVNERLNDMNENNRAELDIGDLSTMKDTVFYWNLVDQFIPEYYSEYLPPEGDPSREEKIEQIADDIYLLYESMGPNHECRSSMTAFYNGTCPDGITVDGVGTIPLEDYVAGVVTKEAYTSEGMEALKAQAVAARTYAVSHTNHCQNSIANSDSAQVFTTDIHPRARQAAEETAGQVMFYNGSVDAFKNQSMYDSFCYADGDCPDSTYRGSSYSVTYTRVPSSSTHLITLSDGAQFGRIVSGKGHAKGMSQLLSYEMAKDGEDYQSILKYFYADGIEIASPGAFSGLRQFEGPWANFRLGNFEGTELGRIGCYVTSLYIIVKRAGFPTTIQGDWDLLAFAQALKNAGTFDAGGSFKHGSNESYARQVVPNLKRENKSYSIESLYDYVSQGYHVMLNIHHPSEHHVVVDSVDVANHKIYMSDPGGFGDELFSAFSGNLTIDSFTIWYLE